MTEDQSKFLYGDPHLGQILKDIRTQRHIPTQRLAIALDVSQTQIARYEAGDLSLSLGQLGRWLDILEVSPNFVFSLYRLEPMP